MVVRRPEIIHGVRNLIQNAVDFAAETIWIDVRERESTLRISVGDDGPGFKPEVLDMLGDPYVTTRGRNRTRGEGEYQGMGLGCSSPRPCSNAPARAGVHQRQPQQPRTRRAAGRHRRRDLAP
jgi:light-regulated signal transduction histidine kinase (bacteriophytochrome)